MTQMPPQPQPIAPPPVPAGQTGPPSGSGGAKVVIAALAMAILAVLILSFYIQSVRNEVAKNKITIWILNNNVRAGDRLTSKDWEAIEVPAQFEEALGRMKAIISKTGDDTALKRKIQRQARYGTGGVEKSIITEALFAKPDLDNTQKVDAGKVRIALPIKSKTTPGGLRPSQYVDIAAPMLTGGQITQTMLIMHNVRVKAVGSYVMTESSSGSSQRIRSFNTISIDVDPDVALMLSTLEKMVRVTGEFEIHIAPLGDRLRPDIKGWSSDSQINPEVVKLIKTNLPAR